MRQKEIDILRDTEYKKGVVYGEGSCRNMIMSCLVYGTTKENFLRDYGSNYVKHTDIYKTKSGNKRYVKEGIFNSLEEVSKIWDDQENYFRNHVRVNHNVYTDSEGLSYDSIVEF